MDPLEARAILVKYKRICLCENIRELGDEILALFDQAKVSGWTKDSKAERRDLSRRRSIAIFQHDQCSSEIEYCKYGPHGCYNSLGVFIRYTPFRVVGCWIDERYCEIPCTEDYYWSVQKHCKTDLTRSALPDHSQRTLLHYALLLCFVTFYRRYHLPGDLAWLLLKDNFKSYQLYPVRREAHLRAGFN